VIGPIPIPVANHRILNSRTKNYVLLRLSVLGTVLFSNAYAHTPVPNIALPPVILVVIFLCKLICWWYL